LCVVEIAKEEHQLAPPLFVGPKVSSPDNRLKLTPFSFKRPANADQTSPWLVSGEEPPDKKKNVTMPKGNVTFFLGKGQGRVKVIQLSALGCTADQLALVFHKDLEYSAGRKHIFVLPELCN